MEMHNWIFEKLQKKTFLIGAFCASCDANLVEILGLNGIDFVVLDMEHSPLDLENMVHMIRAAEMYQVVPIVRVYTPEGKLIRRILDIGAHGIMVPLVDSREETNMRTMSSRPMRLFQHLCSVKRLRGFAVLRRSPLYRA